MGAGRRDPEWDEPRRTGPWPWIAGILALIVLAAAGILGYRVLTGSTPSPAPGQVSVPSFVGRTYADAQTAAKSLGISVEQKAFVQSNDQPEGTVTDQDVAPGTNVDKDLHRGTDRRVGQGARRHAGPEEPDGGGRESG